jgi:hypothetical protein
VNDFRAALTHDAVTGIVVADLQEALEIALRPDQLTIDDGLIDSLITVIEYYLTPDAIPAFRQAVSVKRLYAESQMRQYPA